MRACPCEKHFLGWNEEGKGSGSLGPRSFTGAEVCGQVAGAVWCCLSKASLQAGVIRELLVASSPHVPRLIDQLSLPDSLGWSCGFYSRRLVPYFVFVVFCILKCQPKHASGLDGTSAHFLTSLYLPLPLPGPLAPVSVVVSRSKP